jgi:CHAD domain-containing protein
MDSDYIKLKEIKPAFTGYIRESQAMIEPDLLPGEDTVHDVRVLMKKARAVSALIAPQLNPEYAEREKLALREVGRIMSSWRDILVLRKTLKSLKKDHPGIFSKLEDNEVLRGIMATPEEPTGIPEDVNSGLLKIREILGKTIYRIRFEPMNNFDPHLLLKELGETYKRVIKYYLIARNNPRKKNLHELRKKSKVFLYQLWFFRPLNPPVIRKLEKELESMTRNLGKYNDLSRLIDESGYKQEPDLNDPALNELTVIIREKQDKFLSKVWPIAYKIFAPENNLVNLLGYKILII